MRKQKMKTYDRVFVEAHRGASGYHHDNTMESFLKAIDLKADAIELDIRKTLDGKIIAVHDPTYLDKHINDWLYADLVTATKKDNIVMPLLIDVLLACKGKIILDIELKEEGYEKEVIDLILSILTLPEFYIRSFHENTIRTIKDYNDRVFTILLIGEEFPKYGKLGRIFELFPGRKIKRSKCDAISPNYQLLILGYVWRMHRKGKLVYAWTVDDEKIMKKMITKKKVDGIVTNYPDICLKAIEELRISKK